MTTGRRSDGTPVIVSDGDALTRDVEIWNLDTGKLIGKPSVNPFAFTVTQLVTGRRSDGTPVFVTGATNGRVRIWNLNTGKAPERVSQPLWHLPGGRTRGRQAE
ncbi:hypothetical protein GCM10020220_034120 [Nonomuraea rubra]|uniref:hypothetical protein n=1 Tax=Nonomuraea rubra TaxID=46180 RepID=UPI0031E861EA